MLTKKVMKAQIYLLPGRRESLSEKLGLILDRLGLSWEGRPMTGDFDAMRFSDKLSVIETDLKTGFWTQNSVLVGRSYGGYLMLHVLADLPPFPGCVLLLSPVLGPALAAGGRRGSMPPRSKKLLALAEAGAFPRPRKMAIHTGAADDGCDPELANRFGAAISGAVVEVLPGKGHWLGDELTERIVIHFLNHILFP